MKSPQVEALDCITDKDKYTELKVMQSAAGYYIGTQYYDDEFQCYMPGSRDSDYYPDHATATKALERIQAGDLATRMNP